MFREIKADPRLQHHYIIAVGIKNTTGNIEAAGNFFVKYVPFHFTHEELVNFMKGIALSEDPLYTKQYQVSRSDCMKIMECEKFVMIRPMFMAAKVNNCSIHHFSSEFEISEEYFDSLAKTAKYSSESRRLLNESRMRY